MLYAKHARKAVCQSENKAIPLAYIRLQLLLKRERKYTFVTNSRAESTRSASHTKRGNLYLSYTNELGY